MILQKHFLTLRDPGTWEGRTLGLGPRTGSLFFPPSLRPLPSELHAREVFAATETCRRRAWSGCGLPRAE